MAKNIYISIPTTIEAEQFLENSPDPKGLCRGAMCPSGSIAEPHVHSNHGRIVVEYGEWIATEPDGEHFYPIKPDVFEKKYRLFEQEPTL